MNDDLDAGDLAELRAIAAAASFAQTCAALNRAPDARMALDDIMNTLMTELWDQGFSQTEIRTAFQMAIVDLPRYAAGEERRR